MTRWSDGKGRSDKPVLNLEDTGAENRPAMKPRQPGEILFADAGQTGWGRIRNLGDYKGTKSESNFAHLHNQFFDPAVDPDPDAAA
jgi:hypothetical protein